MRRAVVLGTGGHCRVILTMLAAGLRHDVMGVVELGIPQPDERIMGTMVIPNSDYLFVLGGRDDVDVFLAIGDNNNRKYWWKKVKSLGLPMPNLVSPHALVDDSAMLGESNIICARAFVGPKVVLGDNNLINTAATVEHEVSVGNHCHLAPAATIAGRSHINNRCFVGAGATIVDNVFVASGTVIGAGATLVRTVEQPEGLYLGVPARRRGAKQ